MRSAEQSVLLEQAEGLLEEYTDAVSALSAARIDAGCCGTREDFLRVRKKETAAEELRTKLVAAMRRLKI